MLGIDRKFRLEQDLERLKLTNAEKRALPYVDSHYSSFGDTIFDDLLALEGTAAVRSPFA